MSKTTYLPGFSQKYFLQPNYQTLWKSLYNGFADATFITGIWIAIMKASADVLASPLLKIILNLSGIQKMLEAAKMFTPSLSFWQYLFYPKGSWWWTNWGSMWDMSIQHLFLILLAALLDLRKAGPRAQPPTCKQLCWISHYYPLCHESVLVSSILLLLMIRVWFVIWKCLPWARVCSSPGEHFGLSCPSSGSFLPTFCTVLKHHGLIYF